MRPLRIFNVIPKIPEEIDSLWDLAYNYWFAWNNEIHEVFHYIDPELWKECYGNPVWFLNHVSQKRYLELAEDELYKQRLANCTRDLRSYLNAPVTKIEGQDPNQPAIVYFSLEFGVALCLPIYSGGLGILAGDHLKSASDLNIPLVAMGLLYSNGYFRQYMTPDGWQQERYPDYDFEQMPLRRAKTPSGENAVLQLQIAGRPLAAQIWEAKVGRIRLFLMDTNIPENPQDFRNITARLYGGDLEMRLWQEILLGIGGIKTLEILGLKPQVLHMNEGHSAFAALEKVRSLMKNHDLSFEAAAELSASGNVFTTHTPVPAGNDRFPPELIRKYFESYAQEMGLAFKVFMALGREDPYNDTEMFCMTVLALRLSRFNNGVSKLHGKVSRKMWHKIWSQFPEDDVPIGSITNGIHAPTWVAHEMSDLYDRFLGDSWREDRASHIWQLAANIPDSEIWRAHERQRTNLIDFVRMRYKKQLLAKGARPSELREAEEILNPDALTIGFARRFATYKRANMLLKDQDALLRIIKNTDRPVQFIFAGKAHPQDNGGKQLIKEIINTFRQPDFRHSMIFLEDYDMEVAANMISGCDVWLNNPRRPLEACGTSGMKALFNGVLQFSTLDGWWDEAWKQDNSLGWAIGKGEDYSDNDYQDQVELQTLYMILEQDIIPEFYDRQNGMPRSWVSKMKNALAELGPLFNSNRMVVDYMNTAYTTAFRSNLALCKENFTPARELSEWRMGIMTKWSSVQIRNTQCTKDNTMFVGDTVEVSAEVFMGGIPKEHMRVEVYAGRLGQDDSFIARRLIPMSPTGDIKDGWQKYKAEVTGEESGRYGFIVRALPMHPLLPNQHFGLVQWGG